MLHVIPSLSLVHGGPSIAMRLIERALHMQGVVVEVATTDDGLEANFRDNIGIDAVNDVGTRHYFAKRIDFYKVAPSFIYWIFRHAKDYDLIHIHALFSFTSVIAAEAARFAKVPYIVRPLGTLNRYGMEQRRPWLKRLSLRLIEEPILRRAAAVHFTNKAELTEVGLLDVPMKGVVIPLGIALLPQGDAGIFFKRYPQLRGYRLLMFLSRLDPKKNIEGLLQAFNLCMQSMPDVHLVIAGDGDERYVNELKGLATDLKLNDRVVWLGYVGGDLKRDLLAAASAFVLPSFSENFGIAAVEALMAGIPCVLGEGVAIAKEVEQAGAGVVTAPDAASVADTLTDFLADQYCLSEMSVKARTLAERRFSLEAMGVALSGLYRSILSCEHTKAL